jgi:aspartate/methionine/tyrosine aminotransferase
MSRVVSSDYMHWAKTRAAAPFPLSGSGVADLPLAELPLLQEELELASPHGYGWPPLLSALSRRLGASPDCVVAATGTSMANALAIDAAIEPGDDVLVEDPTYELLVSAARHFGANVRRFPRRAEEGFRLDPEAVAKAMTPGTRLVVVTNLHNPSSVLAGEEELSEVGRIAREAGARVLVDEVYLEALFERRPRSSFALGPNFLATGSLTKAYGLSGLRCGWVLAEPSFARRCWRLNDLYGSTPVHLAERLSVAALDNLGAIAARAQAILAANRKSLGRLLAEHPELDARAPGHGIVVFPRAPQGNGDALAEHLRRDFGTGVVPGRFFGSPDRFRVGIGGVPETTAEGLRRLGLALDRRA